MFMLLSPEQAADWILAIMILAIPFERVRPACHYAGSSDRNIRCNGPTSKSCSLRKSPPARTCYYMQLETAGGDQEGQRRGAQRVGRRPVRGHCTPP